VRAEGFKIITCANDVGCRSAFEHRAHRAVAHGRVSALNGLDE
jgi:hypothetical protein